MLPKVVDLFSGCGGLALGFQKAGFDICTGIEIMPEACKTLNYNLSWRFDSKENHICGDITQLASCVFKDYVGENDCIVIGGPPCQAYSIAGRAKLKSLGEDRVNVNDKRGYLYQDFLRVALDLKAKAVIMENVPESTNYGGKCIPEIVCDVLEKHGYKVAWTILNAADYGVPQIRERVILIAIKDFHSNIILPIPTHKGPEGYRTVHQRRLNAYKEYKHFQEPCVGREEVMEWVSVGDALSDLPALFSNAGAKYVANKMNSLKNYSKAAGCEFQRLMRSWYGCEMSGISGNCFRNTSRDFETFEAMRPDDMYSDAILWAKKRLCQEAGALGIKAGSEQYEKLQANVIPGMNQNSFENKWKRLNSNKPSHTLVAHLSKDTYSHIHPWEPRGISVREAARLQSFPDGFIFNCAMGDAFKQIGNAVPPLMAYNIALALRKNMGD